MINMIEPGQKAPDFSLKNQDDQQVSLHDFSSSWLILYFYPKDNTPGCTTEAKDFTDLTPEFSRLGAKIVGISPDSTQSHCGFIAKHNLSLQLLSDLDHQVAEAYGVWGLKKFMGKEYLGIVRSTFLIAPDGSIAYIWKNVKTKGHAASVLKTLENWVQR